MYHLIQYYQIKIQLFIIWLKQHFIVILIIH